MKKIALSLALTVALCVPGFSGTVKEVSGSVDVLVGGSWTEAYVGMTISDGTKIMTGVGGSMTVSMTGGAFTVGQLSMVTYEESSTDSSSSQNLDLQLGSVDVEFSKISGISSSCSVTTPRGTASIRGTRELVMYFPSSGMHVEVLSGHIVVFDLAGNALPAYEGQQALIDEIGVISGSVDLQDQILEGMDDLSEEDIEFIEEVINNFLNGVTDLDDILGQVVDLELL